MGWGEAQDGNGPENLEMALQVARRVIWRALADESVARGHSVQALRDVVDTLLEYSERLRAELLAGHSLWHRDPYYDEDRARTRLWEFLAPGRTGRISPLEALGVDPRSWPSWPRKRTGRCRTR